MAPVPRALRNYHCIAHATPLNPTNSLQKSATAIITVVDPPNITTSPASQTIPYNQTATLSVAATGTALKYEWFRVSGSGPDISVGTDAPTYTTPALTTDAQYYVRVSNAGPTVRTSAVATISVLESPSLVVTILGDVVNNRDRQTSLREAVAYAEARPGADTITFAAGVQGQTVTVSEGWNGAGDDTALRLPGEVTIDGGTGVTINLASPTARRIFLCGGVFALRNLTLSGGDIRGLQSGGALWSTGTGTVTNVRFTNNRADHGGAIYNLGTMTISGSSFDNNSTAANGHGGAIWSNSTLGVSGTLFSQNTAGQLGGAIASFNGLTVTDSTFSGNQSAFNGGALRLDGTAAISGSTFSNNTAVNGGGALISHGQTAITNSTIAFNTALDGGGAQFFDGTGSLRHVTFASNGATRSGGGVAVNSANVTMTNTIVAANSAPDQNNLWGGPLNAASSNNLLNLNAAQAGLGAFAFNGGPTATVALLAGSPAINAGTNIAGITADQRGVLRPQLGVPDIGAFEFDGALTESLVVTTGQDESNFTSDPAFGTGTSLREALAYAQTLGGAQTITFAPALAGQTVTVVDGWGGAGDNTALRTNTDVTIDGGAGVTINLNSATGRRLFGCTGGALTLRNLTLSGGDIRGIDSGGALWSNATVNITNVRFTNNRGNHGGAIVNFGTMTISGSSFDNNSTAANGQGGAIWSNNTLGISSTLFHQKHGGPARRGDHLVQWTDRHRFDLQRQPVRLQRRGAAARRHRGHLGLDLFQQHRRQRWRRAHQPRSDGDHQLDHRLQHRARRRRCAIFRWHRQSASRDLRQQRGHPLGRRRGGELRECDDDQHHRRRQLRTRSEQPLGRAAERGVVQQPDQHESGAAPSRQFRQQWRADRDHRVTPGQPRG